MRNTTLLACTLGAAFIVAGYGQTQPAFASPHPTTGTCTVQTSNHDLIVWEHEPPLLDNSIEIGDIDLLKCKPTLDTWRGYQPDGPGYCHKIAWADDNPGYEADVQPAAPLKKVLDEFGDC
jgi:hypothetical protein